jgi:multiple sugar transport system permease protein
MSAIVTDTVGGAGRAAAGSPAAPGHRAGRSTRHKLRRRLTVLSFIGPALAGLVLFFGYPLLASVYFSFNRFDLINPPEWVGLANWRFLFNDQNVRQAATNTLWLVVFMVPARIIGAIGIAMLVNRIRHGRSLYRTIFYLPALAPPVVATLAFVSLLKPGTGAVNTILAKIGIEGPLWFNSATWAKPSLVLLGLWGLGDLMIIFVAALLDVPAELYEAASLDGANAWQRFRSITLPSISPVVLFAGVTGVIATLQYFTQAAVAASVASGEATTGGGISSTFGYPEGSTFTYPLWLYVVGFRFNALGYANALAVVLFVVAISVTLVLLRRFNAFVGSTR